MASSKVTRPLSPVHPFNSQRSNGPMSETVDLVFSHYFQTLLAPRPVAPQRGQAEEVTL
jgi:hypothetical protein